jgi:hypothetical protein
VAIVVLEGQSILKFQIRARHGFCYIEVARKIAGEEVAIAFAA